MIENKFKGLEIVLTLNVIQDMNQDGNLNCALIATSNDLFL
jgi:hypothetical protein